MQFAQKFYKKTVAYTHGTHTAQFEVSQELFSSQTVDAGTQRLLRTLLFEHVDTYKKVLDLGCGYGPLGIILKMQCPAAEVHLVDVDALALAFTAQNAALNGVSDVQIYPSFGYDGVTGTDFDLIVSNIPAKVGDSVVRDFIQNARFHLAPAGRVVIVVIDALADFVHTELTRDETISVLFHKNWPGHHVYHFTFTAAKTEQVEELSRTHVYGQELPLQIGKNTFNFDVSYNLPEFDELSYDTELLLGLLEEMSLQHSKILCCNSGQGFIPCFLALTKQPESLTIIDRNLLALETTAHNLSKVPATARVLHQVELTSGVEDLDVITFLFPEKTEPAVCEAYLDQLSGQVRQKGRVVLASSSTALTRVEAVVALLSDFKCSDRKRKKGRSALVLTRK